MDQGFTIMTPDGRRAWAFAAICGGCMVFTVFAAVGVWLVSGNLRYTFYLALAAHVQIVIGMTALGWALGRRMQLDVGKDGAKISDQDGQTSLSVTATATKTPPKPPTDEKDDA